MVKYITDYFYFNIIAPIILVYSNIKNFICNLIKFRKQLWNYRDCDWEYSLELFIFSLELLANKIENSSEEPIIKTKKAYKIRELIELINKAITLEDDFASYSEINAVINKIIPIIKGQNIDNFKYESDKDRYQQWVRQFDGSGIQNWWV